MLFTIFRRIKAAIFDEGVEKLHDKGKSPMGPENSDCDAQILANHPIKRNGFNPNWLEERKTLLQEIRVFHKDLVCTGNILEATKETILQLNNRISGYNLRVPVAAMKLQPIPIPN